MVFSWFSGKSRVESVVWSTVYWTELVIIYRCKEKMKVVLTLKKVERRSHMFIILFILFIGIPLLKEEMENQSYREVCRRRGDKTYWSTDGLRYTGSNQKVYK